jgi:hypothetical protein
MVGTVIHFMFRLATRAVTLKQCVILTVAMFAILLPWVELVDEFADAHKWAYGIPLTNFAAFVILFNAFRILHGRGFGQTAVFGGLLLWSTAGFISVLQTPPPVQNHQPNSNVGLTP